MVGAGGPSIAAPRDSISTVPLGGDIQGTPAQLRLYASRLESRRPGEWREAQIRLAWAGVPALQVVDSTFSTRRPPTVARYKGYLSLALLASVTPEDLERFRRLRRLAAADIALGLAMATAAVDDTIIPDGSLFESDRQRDLGGFAVPGAVFLCSARRPGARARGVSMLLELGAFSQIPLLESMRADPGKYLEWHGDVGSMGVVGDAAAQADAHLLGALASRQCNDVLIVHSVSTKYQGDLDELLTGLRDYTGVVDQCTWETWWNAARPAWNAWWDIYDSSPGEASMIAWRHRMEETQGWRLGTAKSGSEHSTFKVEGPRSILGEVWLGDRLLRRGHLPLVVRGELDQAIRDVRERAGRGEQVGSGIRIVATRADGWRWEHGFASALGTEYTLTLLEKPRRLPGSR
jgi:hypothetical protein